MIMPFEFTYKVLHGPLLLGGLLLGGIRGAILLSTLGLRASLKKMC